MIMLDLTNCLNTTEKNNIELDVIDNAAHITATLWLWDNQYVEIIDRCNISNDLKLSSQTIIYDTDVIINVYADISATDVSLSAFVDTGETYTDYKVPLMEQEIKTLKQCFDNALKKQFGTSLSKTLTTKTLA